MIQQTHLDLLLELDTDKSLHSGGALLDHLRGTHDLLQAWGNDPAVCRRRVVSQHLRHAGLLDSVRFSRRPSTHPCSDRRARRTTGIPLTAFRIAVTSSKRWGRTLPRSGIAFMKRPRRSPRTRCATSSKWNWRNWVEFMPRLSFTDDELTGFEAKRRTQQGPHHHALVHRRQGGHREQTPMYVGHRCLTGALLTGDTQRADLGRGRTCEPGHGSAVADFLQLGRKSAPQRVDGCERFLRSGHGVLGFIPRDRVEVAVVDVLPTREQRLVAQGTLVVGGEGQI